MHTKNHLGSSVSILIVAVVAILAFVRGKALTPLLLAAFMLWGLRAAWKLLLPAWRHKALLQSIEDTSALLRQYDLRIKEMYEAYISGKLIMAEYISVKAAAVQEREELAKRLHVQKAQYRSANENSSVNNRYITVFREYADVKELTSEILTEVLEEVVVYPDWRIEIKWKLRQEYEELIMALYGGTEKAKNERVIVLQNRPA